MTWALGVWCGLVALMCLLWSAVYSPPESYQGRHRGVGRATWSSSRALREARAAVATVRLPRVRRSLEAALAYAPPRQARYDQLAGRVLAAQASADRRAAVLARSWGTQRDMAGVT